MQVIKIWWLLCNGVPLWPGKFYNMVKIACFCGNPIHHVAIRVLRNPASNALWWTQSTYRVVFWSKGSIPASILLRACDRTTGGSFSPEKGNAFMWINGHRNFLSIYPVGVCQKPEKLWALVPIVSFNNLTTAIENEEFSGIRGHKKAAWAEGR